MIASVADPVLNEADVRGFFDRHRAITRARVVAAGLLHAAAPDPGTTMLTAADRTSAGERLRDEAKGTLTTLLYGIGDGSLRVVVDHHELLTLIVPSVKLSALSFLRGATITATTGTWRDPMNGCHDHNVANVAVDVEYGETSDEIIGRTVMVAIRVLNLLEINEHLLYARSIDVEDSTLLL